MLCGLLIFQQRVRACVQEYECGMVLFFFMDFWVVVLESESGHPNSFLVDFLHPFKIYRPLFRFLCCCCCSGCGT